MIEKRDFYIEGKWVAPEVANDCDVIDPSTEEACAVISLGAKADVDKAVAAARRAFPAWAATPLEKRIALLEKLDAIMQRRMGELGEAISLEMGAPIDFAINDQAPCGPWHMQGFLEGVKHIAWEEPFADGQVIVREPIGVCGLITPWNFPIGMIAKKLSAALAAGCPSVIKPASETPLTMIALFALMDKHVDLPDGMVNLVMGKASVIGKVLCESPDVPMLSFTGSTEVGTALYTRATQTLKKVQAEMGGKNAVIVLEDADMDSALGGIVQGAFGSTGQRCTATSRVVVQESVYDAFMTELIERTSKLTVGDGLDPAMDIAPLSSQSQFNTVMEYIGIGAEEGATIAYGGNPRTEGDLDEGYYVEPTIFTNVDTNMRIAQEEIFGPVLTVFKAADLEEAVSITNNVKFGLSSSIYTMDIPQAFRYIDTVETGIVHVNSPTLGGEVHLPFGGMKESGVGTREQGTEAINFFTEPVTVYIDYSSAARA